MRWFHLLFLVGADSAAIPDAVAAEAAPITPIEQIIVTATLRDDTPLAQVPASVAVLDRATISAAAVEHFEELAALVPNLNWSGEGSRARYFQIRGIGELEQYEGAPNPSVGFIVDDIDFSAIGGVATTFDTARIEILRGPQGTRYGANALAGLIYIQSAGPSAGPEFDGEATGGSDDTWSVGAAAGGPVAGLGETLGYRVAVQRYQSDGFRHDAFLLRDDTYRRDETTARGKLRWKPSADWQVDFTAMYVDLDNGYDAWAIDNSLTTQSDQPGQDAQRSRAGALRITGNLNDAVTLVSITGVADSDIVFSFDADWGNDAFWAPDIYSYTQRTDRERRTVNQELRLISRPDGRLFGRVDWVLGAYGLALDETNRIVDHGLLDLDDSACAGGDPTFCEPYATDDTLDSDYDATSLALFGELEAPLGDRYRLTVGLRGERRVTDYHDQFDDRAGGTVVAHAFSPADRMWGGDLTLSREFAAGATAYARIARGYKAGGFNPSLARVDFSQTGLNVSPAQIPFDSESLWNYELGARLEGNMQRWWANLSLFWQERDHPQVRVPIQFQAGDPNTFILLTDNAESGRALGLEADAGWHLTEALTLDASLGLLDTEVSRFAASPEFENHPFPHAPPYSFAVGATYESPAGWFGRLDVTGRGSFYYDYDLSQGDDRKSDQAEIVNLRAGRHWDHWQIEAWARNLFDEAYTVRGFYFGNEPPDFSPTRYTRLGDPRQVGATLRYKY